MGDFVHFISLRPQLHRRRAACPALRSGRDRIGCLAEQGCKQLARLSGDMPHKLTHCIWCSDQSLVIVIPAVCTLTVLRHSAWNSTIHLIMAWLFSWGVYCKTKSRWFKAIYIYIFLSPCLLVSGGPSALGCIPGWFGFQEAPCTSSFSLSKWPPSYKNLAEWISIQGF